MGLSKQLLFLNFDLNNGNTPNFKEDIGEYYFSTLRVKSVYLKTVSIVRVFLVYGFFCKKEL